MTFFGSDATPRPNPLTLSIGALAASAALVGCADTSDTSGNGGGGELGGGVATIKTTVEATHPWDQTSFTQGVEQATDGRILVGTGHYGESRIYWTTTDGVQSESQPLDEEFFGEGVTIAGDAVWQLTWKKQVAIKRDADTLAEIGRASYSGEGWGLCAQQDRLVMSDGTGTLTFRDPESFDELDSVDVTLAGEPVTMLNELECVGDGETVWANVW